MDLFSEEAFIRCSSIGSSQIFKDDVSYVLHKPRNKQVLGRTVMSQLAFKGENMHSQHTFNHFQSVFYGSVALRFMTLWFHFERWDSKFAKH